MPGNSPNQIRRRLWIYSFAAIALLWAVLYLPHLRTSPGWYGDETVTLACGQDLIHGIFANRGAWNTYVNPQYCYQPGYVALVGAASEWTGRDILAPRFLNTLLALGISLMALCLLGRRFGVLFGLLSALTFLCYLQSVIHFRWVYAHNAVAAGFFLCFAVLCLRQTSKNAWLSGIGLAIAAIAHPLALQGGIAAGLCRWNQPRTWIPLYLPPLLAGLAVLLPVFLWSSQWMIEDIGHLAAFYKLYSDQNASGFQGLVNFANFYTQDFFHVLAALALIFTLFTRLRPLAIGALVLSLFLTFNRQNLPLFYYQAIVILPLLTTSLAWAIWRLCCIVRRRQGSSLFRWIPFALPLFLLAQSLPSALNGTLLPRNNYWVTQSIPDLERTVDWVNQHTTPSDLVIAHWNTGWQLHAKTADPFQAAAYAGLRTHTFEHMPGKERFRFDLSPEKVKYVIIGDIDLRWTLGGENIRKWFEDSGITHWPTVFATETYFVVQNPAFP